ncbi:PQQ-binding-like beta-propeller repeat protein [Thalassoroseus pseudoceratinae]|uniref:PQQ-binding-like beta-propeller repeat protein n=1 Tax=Thalassoroseus pseudoceratinae TaxID=2713176 RepID=UPI00141F2489|nr:PQQ-binding-like beta-propeller repeat protein [Thalassoroseus pseudoceratinae]
MTTRWSLTTRFLILAAIWIVAVAVHLVLHNLFQDDRTNQIMMFYIVPPTAVFWTLVWWVVLAPFSWKTRIITLLVGLSTSGAAVAGALTYYKFEGFWGDFRPRFSRRGAPSAEDEFLASRKKSDAPQNNTDGETATDVEPLTIQPGDCPQFRGTDRNGVYDSVNVPREWDGTPPKELWRRKVGPAWSSFTVVDGHIFTQMQIGEDECVVCYDLETGDELWVHRDEGVRFSEPRAGTGPMATPTFDNNRLYTLGATGVLNCLDPQTGQEFWQTNILKDAGVGNLEWGMTGSPLVFDGKVVVNPGSDGEDATSLTAYDAETGKKLWSDGTRGASYSAPMLATIDGVQQILIFDAYGLAGHDAESGKRLWEFEWTNQPEVNVAMPIIREDGAILISTSYGVGSALLRVTQSNGKWSAKKTDWEDSPQFKLKFGDAVQDGNTVYGLSETILTGFDIEKGKILWRKRGGYGYGQVLLADGILIVLSEEGEVSFVDPNGSRQPVLVEFQAIEGKTWGHPVVVPGKLLVRNAAEMACFDISEVP